MKILYLNLNMGVAGDMLTAALLDLLDPLEQEAVIEELNAAGVPEAMIRVERSSSAGIGGLRSHVTVGGVEEGADGEGDQGHHHEGHGHGHDHGCDRRGRHERDRGHEYHGHHERGHHEHHDGRHDHDHHEPGHHDHHAHHDHHHAFLDDVLRIVDALRLPDDVKRATREVYAAIAEAESAVHGGPVGEVHFHEVGAADAIMDVAAVSLLLKRIEPDVVVASPVNVGSGTVRCAHGILPVPAPATARLLKGIPAYSDGTEGELCTPTGAALLGRFVDRFGDLPLMDLQATGYGIGKRHFENANVVRAMLGESVEIAHAGKTEDYHGPRVVEIGFNVDDMSGEDAAYLVEKLLDEGALDAYWIPIGMKKGRPGLEFRVTCRAEDKGRTLSLIFAHSTTIGVREYAPQRHVMSRRMETIDTELGPVRVKVSSGFGATRRKVEFEDIRRIAQERGTSIAEARRWIETRTHMLETRETGV